MFLWTGSLLVQVWLVAYLAPIHDLNQCWRLVNWKLGNKFQRKIKWNSMYLLNTLPSVITKCQTFYLTHGGRVTHICVGILIIIGSDNGLAPGWRQAIIIFIQESALEIVVREMASILSRPQCVKPECVKKGTLSVIILALLIHISVSKWIHYSFE